LIESWNVEMTVRYLIAPLGMAFLLVAAADLRAEDAAPSPATPVAAPADAAAPTTEPPPTKELFEAGQQLFRNRCARCHGWNMVNLGSISFDLRKFPHDDRARFFHSVTNGKNSMPAWKDILSQQEIESVWAYVRTGGKM
jgi:mono/diheme cytochrome c family protein